MADALLNQSRVFERMQSLLIVLWIVMNLKEKEKLESIDKKIGAYIFLFADYKLIKL